MVQGMQAGSLVRAISESPLRYESHTYGSDRCRLKYAAGTGQEKSASSAQVRRQAVVTLKFTTVCA